MSRLIMYIRLFVVVFLVTFLFCSRVSAAPLVLNYQGQLTDSGGNPVTGTVNMTFAIYDASVSGNLLWTTDLSVDVNQGYFSVYLGKVTALDSLIFDGSSRYLGVTVETDAELSPRQEIASAAYAITAQNSENRYTDSEAVAAISTAPVSWTQLTDVPADIADGDNDTVGNLSCVTGELPRFDGAAWVCSN